MAGVEKTDVERIRERTGIRKKVATKLFPDAEQSVDPLLIADDKLEDAGKWIAGSFTAAAAVLTFFGVEGGVLDRVLRTFPRPALFIFCLLAAAVGVGVLAPILKSNQRVAIPLIILVVAIPGWLIWQGFPELPDSGDRVMLGEASARIVAGALVVLAIALRKSSMAVIAATLVIGIAFFGFGIYGTAKLSVLTKGTSEQPQLSAEIVTEGTNRALKVTALASRLDEEYLVIRVSEAGGGEDGALLGSARLNPDVTGAVDRSISFPLPQGYRREVVLAAARCPAPPKKKEGDPAPGAPEPCDPTFDEELRFSLGSHTGPQVTGRITPRGRHAVAARVQATGLRPAQTLRLTLEHARGRGRPARITTMTAGPGPDGELAWAETLRVRDDRARIIRLTYRLCTSTRCGEPRVLATLNRTPLRG